MVCFGNLSLSSFFDLVPVFFRSILALASALFVVVYRPFCSVEVRLIVFRLRFVSVEFR